MGSLNEAAKAKKLQRQLQTHLAQAMVAWLQSTKGTVLEYFAEMRSGSEEDS